MPLRRTRRFRSHAIAALVCACLVAIALPVTSAVAASSASVVGPTVLVRPTDSTVGAANARVVAAGGEFESVQVVVRATDAPVAALRVAVVGTLSGPGGATIPASSITVYRVGYQNLTGLPSDGDMGGVLGRYPDSLIPTVDPVWGEARTAFPIDVPAGENRLAWIDVLVPAGRAAGTYAGASIRVTSGAATLHEIPLEVEVADVDLPSTTTLDGGFDINPNQVCRAHACGAQPGGQAGLLATYARVALDNRLTLAKPPTATPSSVTDQSYRDYTRPLLLGTAPTRLVGAKLKTVTIYQWAKSSAGTWRRLAEADDFVARVRFHCDEIAKSAAAWGACQTDYTQANAAWRAAATSARGPVTDLPLEVTTSIDDVAWARANGYGALADRISVLIPVINYVHPKNVAAFPGRRAEYAAWNGGTTAGGAPKELWTYTSCMSMGCSPNLADNDPFWSGWPSYGVDQPASQARAMGWISYLYDARGEYYYETARDLPTAWSNLWSNDGGNHGDGTFFYPGTVAAIGGTHDTAIESIRLKRVRDGREDYELLKLAETARGRSAVLAVARTAYSTAHATNVPQSQVESARATLFGMVAGTTPRAAWAEPSTPTTPPVTPPVTPPITPPAGGSGTGGSSAGSGTGTAAGTPTVATPGVPVAGTGTPNREIRGTAPAAGTTTPTPEAARPTAARAVFCNGRRATIVGTAGNDVLRGTRGADVIVGLAGNDRITGLGGGDTICTGSGTDIVASNGGSRTKADTVVCGAGRDTVTYDRRDRLRGTCERTTRRG